MDNNPKPFKIMKDRNGRTLVEFLKEKERERPKGLTLLGCRPPRLSMAATVRKLEEKAPTLDENSNKKDAASKSPNNNACENKEDNLLNQQNENLQSCDQPSGSQNVADANKRNDFVDSPGMQFVSQKCRRILGRRVLLDEFDATVDSDNFSPMVMSTPKAPTVAEGQNLLRKKSLNQQKLKSIAEEKQEASKKPVNENLTKPKSASNDPENEIEEENEESPGREDVEQNSPTKKKDKIEESHREENVLRSVSPPVNSVEPVPPHEESLNKVNLMHEEDGNINETEKKGTRKSSLALDLVLNNGARYESPSGKRENNLKRKRSLAPHLWDLRLKSNLEKETRKPKKSMPLNREPGLAINGEAFAEELKVHLTRLTNREILDLRKRHSGNFNDSLHLMPKRKSIIPHDLTEEQKIQLCAEIEIELKKRDIPIEPPSLPIKLLTDTNNVQDDKSGKNLTIEAEKAVDDTVNAKSPCPLQDFFDDEEDKNLPPMKDGERVETFNVQVDKSVKNLNIEARKAVDDKVSAKSPCPLQDFFDSEEDEEEDKNLPPIKDGERVETLMEDRRSSNKKQRARGMENLDEITVLETQIVEPLPHASTTTKDTGAITKVIKSKKVNACDTAGDGLKKPIDQPLKTRKKNLKSNNHQDTSNEPRRKSKRTIKEPRETAMIRQMFSDAEERRVKKLEVSMQKSQLLNTIPLASSTQYTITSGNKQKKNTKLDSIPSDIPLEVVEEEGALCVQALSKQTNKKPNQNKAMEEIFDTVKGATTSDQVLNANPTTETEAVTEYPRNTTIDSALNFANEIVDLISQSDFVKKLCHTELETPMGSLTDSTMYTTCPGFANFSELEFRLFKGVEWAHYYTEEKGEASYMRLRPHQITPKLPVPHHKSVFMVMSGVVKATVGQLVMTKSVADAFIANGGRKYSIENLKDSVALLLVLKG